MPPTVAIIGAGPLGRWLALTAARAGFPVLLEDVMPGNLHHAQEILRRQLSPAALGLDSGSLAAPAIAFVSTIEDAVREADLANCTYRPEKCIAIAAEAFELTGTLAPEILLRTTPRTSPETIALVQHFWLQLGFTPTFKPDPTA